MGKTVARARAWRATSPPQTGRPVVFFSMEMGTLELTKRLLVHGGARRRHQALDGQALRSTTGRKISHAVGRLAEAQLFIDDNPHCTVMEMRAKARRMRARHGDLGARRGRLHPAHDAELQQARREPPGRGVGDLARAQDPRPRARVPGRRARRSSTASSSTARTSARCSPTSVSPVVSSRTPTSSLFIYRDEVYNPESDDRGKAEVIIAKHRNGPTGKARAGVPPRARRVRQHGARLSSSLARARPAASQERSESAHLLLACTSASLRSLRRKASSDALRLVCWRRATRSRVCARLRSRARPRRCARSGARLRRTHSDSPC